MSEVLNVDETKVDAGSTTEPKTVEPTSEDELVPKRALLDERRKRQDEETRRQELEDRIKELERQSAPQQEESVDFWSDPMGYLKKEKQQIALSLGQDFMRTLHPDYDVAEQEFLRMARSRPDLVKQLNTVANPAKFVYDTVQKEKALGSLTEKDALIKQLQDKLSAYETPNIAPKTLSTATNVNSDHGPSAKTLEDIMGR